VPPSCSVRICSMLLVAKIDMAPACGNAHAQVMKQRSIARKKPSSSCQGALTSVR
jgi:hypothetical protein